MRQNRPLHSHFARLHAVGLLGMLVILLWGLSSWFRALAYQVPPLELTGIALASAAVCARLLPGASGGFTAALRGHPWYAWCAVVGGLTGGAAFYFSALGYAPPEQVVVITYTWPLLFAMASDLFNRRKPAPTTLIGLLMGLAGVAVMNGWTDAPGARAWIGYALGLLSGLCWVGYSLFVQVYSRPLGRAYPAFLAVAAAGALSLQVALGGFVWPLTFQSLVASVGLGIGPYGLGFIAWGYVIRNGNPRVTPMLPYCVPGVAAVALVVVGRINPTVQLFAGCLLVLAACAMVMRQYSRAG